MILVDTSVWVRFLAGREPYAKELDRLLTKLLTEYERMALGNFNVR